VTDVDAAADTWERTNAEHLAAGLDWLRSRLDGGQDDWPEGWTGARAGGVDCRPGLDAVANVFGLSAFERAVLLLAVGVEFDSDLAARCAADGVGAGPPAPCFATALRFLPGGSWDALAPHGPLRHWRLVTVDRAPGGSLLAAPIVADERIANVCKGLNAIDDRLTGLLRSLAEQDPGDLPPSQQRTVEHVLAAWFGTRPGRPPTPVQLVGADARTRRMIAGAAAGAAGLRLLEIVPSQLGTAPGQCAELVRLLERESLLMPIGFYLDCADQAEIARGPVSDLVADLRAPILLSTADGWVLPGRDTRLVEIRRPTAGEQERLWAEALGEDCDEAAALLAAHFDLDPETIGDCAEHGRAAAVVDGRPVTEAVWAVCRDRNRPHMAALASCITPQADWDDLVLPPEELASLHRLAAQVRGRPAVLRAWAAERGEQRGRGITAMFAGQPGTGKTLAAEVLAHDLELILYRIDLSAVVSKYIGETERNLRRVFDAADQGGGLLFFDEADALFGRRSEVKDAHDRYANIEVNYLLQRMEDFSGVAILATNQAQALDQAFLRRLRMVVTFPFPSEIERRLLWAGAFPPGTPVAALDFERLAALPANGGMIRNIAVNAAFCAAGEGGSVDMPLLLAMARAEFAKFHLPLPEQHFRLAEVS
jgi:ATPase family associated with various cellular activities (AAA)